MSTSTATSYTIRKSRPSDIPEILAGHRTQYVDINGWNEYFMSIVDGILTDWTASHDPALERFWVAEHSTTAEFLGCVMLINKPTAVPKETESVNENPDLNKSEKTTRLENSKEQNKTARLRVLYVSPSARGMGLGRALVRLTADFAREVGYRNIQLSTCTVQGSAIRIYEQEGYREISWEENEKFGLRLRHLVMELEL
jgi:ribosomal protein S18 acetylase RimI-like enzyme